MLSIEFAPAASAGCLAALSEEARRRAAGARLVVASEGLRAIAPVSARSFTIGRAGAGPAPEAGAGLQLDHPSLDEHHARIDARHGRFVVTDLGSASGTLVGDERLAPHVPRELAGDTAVTFGCVRALFVCDAGRDGAPLPRRRDDVALCYLERTHLLTRRERAHAERAAQGERPHVAEQLVLAGVLDPATWCEAVALGAVVLAVEERLRRELASRLLLLGSAASLVAVLGWLVAHALGSR